eukprot:jgi/Hompol1/5614/HPOL_004577-RA
MYVGKYSPLTWVRVGEFRWAIRILNMRWTIVVEKDRETGMILTHEIKLKTYNGSYFKQQNTLDITNTADGDETSKSKIVRSGLFTTDSIIHAIKGADTYIESSISHTMLRMLYRTASWRRLPPTEKQIKLAIRMKMIENPEDAYGLTRGDISDATLKIELGSLKEARKAAKKKSDKDKAVRNAARDKAKRELSRPWATE